MVPPVEGVPVVHCPIPVSEPQVPVKISIARPFELPISFTVTVAVPVEVAVRVNQTLLVTVLSPQSSTSPLPAVAPDVLLVTVLLAHKVEAPEQLLF